MTCEADLPVEFFEKYFKKIELSWLCENDFSCYFENMEKKEKKMKMVLLNKGIDCFSTTPCNTISCLPKGGFAYLEMLNRYDFN